MFDGKNFDEFDESKFHCQNFPFQHFAVELNNSRTSTCNIYGSHKSACLSQFFS